jgi:hypothetical protein
MGPQAVDDFDRLLGQVVVADFRIGVQLLHAEAVIVLLTVLTIMLVVPVARMPAARRHDDSFQMESRK